MLNSTVQTYVGRVSHTTLLMEIGVVESSQTSKWNSIHSVCL